jgi:radical SAM superfamily enzyme YgiQ (UPF0313 family)
MHIQLIHPPVYLNVHAMTALRPALPLGLAYVAGSLRTAGHTLSLVDAVAEAPDSVTQENWGRSIYRLGLSPAEISARIDPKAGAIGLTNMWSFSWPLVRRILQQLKQDWPDKPIVCGGEHFTGMAEQSMQQAPIDVIVLGEGEEHGVAVFDALERGEREFPDIDGILYRGAADQLIRNRPKARRRDVDAIPLPYWELFDVDTYHEHDFVAGLHAGKTIPILATRGCPYQCTYCSSPSMWTTRWYARDPAKVVDEMEHYMQAYGAENFPFQDLTAIVKRDWIISFCNEILRRNLKFTWQFPSGTRCEVIDDEVAKLLRLTGGKALAYAPESGSERTRKLIKKQMKTSSLMNAVKASVRHKLNITSFIVIGFPHDTKEDLRLTAKLARRLAWEGIDDIAIGFFFPIPNTELYHRLKAEGRITDGDEFLLTPIYANDEKLEEDNNYCDHLTAKQLTLWKYRLLANFYLVSLAAHPWRALALVWNTLRGKETRKMETFLIELKRKGIMWVKGKLGRFDKEQHRDKSPAPAASEG